jgi:hypothetical protein
MREVSETEATGTVAQIYEDIRAVQGLPIVNLIWRRLACQPANLQWAWATARPLYATGAARRHAEQLAESLDLPVATTLTPDVLHAVGLGDADMAAINAMIDTYNAGNGMNLMALSTLLAAIRNPDRVANRDAHYEPTTASARPIRATESPSPNPAMPTIPDINLLEPHVRTLVYRLNGLGTETGSSPVLATLYRHAAHWPNFLALVWMTLSPLDEGGQLLRAIASTKLEASRRGSELARELDAVPAGAAATDAASMIEQFVAHAISRMFVIGSVVRRCLPRGVETNSS